MNRNIVSKGNESEKKLFVYLLVCFTLSWIISFAAILGKNNTIFSFAKIIIMFVPLLSVIITNRSIHLKKYGIHMKLKIKENWKNVIVAVWAPILLSTLGAVLYFIIFPDKFSFEFPYISEKLEASGANEVNVRVYVLMQVVCAITIAPFINMLFAIGEEVGWRGFMTPLLMRKHGKRLGTIISGTIWGIWHWPLIIFTGYQYGSGYWGAPFTGMFVMLLFTVSLGTLLTYLYTVSHCIWIPSLAHGSINAISGIGLYFMKYINDGYFFRSGAFWINIGYSFMFSGYYYNL